MERLNVMDDNAVNVFRSIQDVAYAINFPVTVVSYFVQTGGANLYFWPMSINLATPQSKVTVIIFATYFVAKFMYVSLWFWGLGWLFAVVAKRNSTPIVLASGILIAIGIFGVLYGPGYHEMEDVHRITYIACLTMGFSLQKLRSINDDDRFFLL
jgi:fatty acid desaturase